MNRPIVSSITVMACVITSGLFAQSVAPQPRGSRAEWPTHAPYDAGIHAFDAALTRAGWDASYRKRLTSCDSARRAVAEEGNINVPSDRVILFYEAQNPKAQAASLSRTQRRTMAQSRMSENVHVFVLPPFNPKKKTQYKYEDWFMCCYDWWVRSQSNAATQPSR